jgi:hypothetical protein
MHLRALTADVLAYKQRGKAARLKVFDALAAEGQRLKPKSVNGKATN